MSSFMRAATLFLRERLIVRPFAGFYEETGETANATLAAFAARNTPEIRKAEIRYRNAAV